MGYPGGKSGPGVYHRLINLMPPHYTYVEPFLGGGAVMRLKRPAPYNIGVDLDAAVIREWRSHIPETADSAGAGGACFSLPSGPGGKIAAARAPSNSPTAAASGERADGGHLVGTVSPPISADACGSTDTISADARRRRSVDSPTGYQPRFRFLRGDALTFLQSYPFAPDDLIYCDPPYLPETLASRPRYRHNFSDEQHAELLASIGDLSCHVMISGYWSKLYASCLHRWNHIHFEAMTRGGMATEWLWFNFEPPVQLHDYRYLGESAHKRQDLKRQIASWRGKLNRMSALKKQALLAAIAAAGGNDAGIR
jgi:hypothetical protein